MDDVREKIAHNGHGDGSKHVDRKVVVFQASFFRGELLNYGYVSPHLSAIKRRFGKGTTNPICRGTKTY